MKTILNYIVVEEIVEKKDVSDGGILLVDFGMTQKKTEKGRIVASGPGIVSLVTGTFIPNKLKVGDVILYSVESLNHFKYKDVIYRVTLEPLVLALLPEEK